MISVRLAALAVCLSVALRAPGVLAAGADLDSATDADKAKASTHYTQGMASFQAGDAAGALEEFRLSYQAVQSPNSHLMVAKALIDLGRYVEAYPALKKTIAEAKDAQRLDPKYAQTQQAAEEELRRVETQVVEISINVSNAGPDATIEVNDQRYEKNDLDEPVVAAPGPVHVRLIEDGKTTRSETLQGSAGEALEVDLEPAAEPEEASPAEEAPSPSNVQAEKRPFPHRRETAYVAAGLGLGGALTFGVFGLLDNAKYSDVQDQCDNDICSHDLQSDAARGHTYQTIANVGLIVGVVGLGTAVTLWLTEDDSKSAQRSGAHVALGPGKVTVGGTF